MSKGFVYESNRVHLAAENPKTGRLGTCHSPTDDISTACQITWDTRPRRSMRSDLVTCEACKSTVLFAQLEMMR